MNNKLTEYQKPPLSFQKQLEKLQQRGLIIDDWATALTSLSNINYYRLSAYWLPFKRIDSLGNITDAFQKNSAFNDVLDLYEFDRKLRLLIMDAIERIEVSIRTSITYHLAHKCGPFVLLNKNNFHENFEHRIWLNQINEEINRSRERFIEHFKGKYHGFPNLPVWMATEVLSFGSLSILYKGLKNEDKREIAKKNYNLHPKTIANWLHFLTYIRNICAHHSRLWNKELAIRPTNDSLNELWLPPLTPRNDRSYIILLIIRYLLKITNNGKNWASSCEQLLNPILKQYNWAYDSMGIPKDWLNHPLWTD